MKINTGFISNSSAASYIIAIDDLTIEQLYQIFNHIETAIKLAKRDKIPFQTYRNNANEVIICTGCYEIFHDAQQSERWDIEKVDKNHIRCETIIDNFRMYEFLKYIKIPEDAIEIEFSQNDR